MTRYEPMDVTIEQDADDPRMSGPEPPYNPNWPLIDELRWRAGIIRANTGVTVVFSDTAECTGPGYHDTFPTVVGVMIPGDGGTSCIQRPGHSLNQYLDGIEAGAGAAKAAHATP